ncbi:MAG: hypothetical protein AB1585_03995 [Thermodesulfobacteriota bacterium]
MKSRFAIALILLASVFILGMGKMGPSEKAGEIPLAEKEVKAVITDNQGLTLNLTQFSVNGQVFLTGRLGAGRVTIPFNRIRTMVFSFEPKGTNVTVELTDGSQTTLSLEKGQTVYGKIRAGAYQVSIDHLKKIEIQAVAERKKEKE